MDPQALKVLNHLHEVLKDSRGSLTTACNASGHSKGYLTTRISRGADVWLGDFMIMCRSAGHNPTIIINDALSGSWFQTEEYRVRKFLNPSGEAPREITRILEASGIGLGQEKIRDIEQIRKRDPERALKLVYQKAKNASRHEISFLLSIAASCYRIGFKFSEAAHCLFYAKQLADKYSEADALMRRYIFLDNLDCPKHARQDAQEACLIFARTRNFSRVGETLVAQAGCLLHEGDTQGALERFREAHGYRDFLDSESAAACYLGLALCNDNAEANLTLAIEYAKKTGNPELTGKIIWAEGVIKKSEKAIRKAVDMLLRWHPVEAALAMIDLVCLLNERGDCLSAAAAARSAFRLADKLSFVPDIERAILRLVDVGERNFVERSILSTLRSEVELSRARLIRARLSP